MSTPTERDKQFYQAATLQADEIEALMRAYGRVPIGEMFTDHKRFFAELRLLLARRDYDFLVSSHFHTSMLATWDESRERVALVPDMTEWPPLD